MKPELITDFNALDKGLFIIAKAKYIEQENYYIVSDVMRGDRENVELKNLKTNKMWTVNIMNVRWIDFIHVNKDEHPEYFL